MKFQLHYSKDVYENKKLVLNSKDYYRLSHTVIPATHKKTTKTPLLLSHYNSNFTIMDNTESNTLHKESSSLTSCGFKGE